MKKYLEAGKVVSTHGIGGEVKIYPMGDSAETLRGVKKLFLDSDGKRFLEVLSVRIHKNMALVRLKNFNDITEARKLIDRVFFVDRSDVPVEEGAYFVADLIGLRVIDADDPSIEYGTLRDVTQTSAHDLYHIALKSGKTGLLPAVAEMVVAIDPGAGEIRIRPAKGLFDYAY